MATGMQPQTTVVILYEEDGETSIMVRNTDSTPALLHSIIEDIPEDTESLVLLTPPVSRVEPGDNQLVRFLLQTKVPLKTERLKRVIFEGINARPQVAGRGVIGVSVRQNLPLIIHPKGLPRNREPWKLLQWRVEDSKLIVANNSAYVVRLGAEIVVNPSREVVTLPRTYVLPGETLSMPTKSTTGATSVTISPATVYGFVVDRYEAVLADVKR
jgi:P pilus assembly chaperone PapD